MRHWRRRDLWRCEEGTPGHRAALGLEPEGQEPIVHKAAFDPFAGGALDRVLDDLQVGRLLIAGMHLHACVREAALGAHARERLAEVWVAEDAVTSDDPAHAAVTRRYLEARDVRFIPVAKALAELDGDVKQAAGAAREVVHDAAARVRDAALCWRERPVSARAQLLERAAELLESQAASIAMQMAEEIAKPVRFGELEVARAAEMLRAIARRCSDAAEVELVRGVEVRRRPLGVVAVITPWNNPVYIPLGKIAAALAHGNGVLWKPAPHAQAIAERMAETLHEAGLPEGLLALTAGDRHAAQLVMSRPRGRRCHGDRLLARGLCRAGDLRRAARPPAGRARRQQRRPRLVRRRSRARREGNRGGRIRSGRPALHGQQARGRALRAEGGAAHTARPRDRGALVGRPTRAAYTDRPDGGGRAARSPGRAHRTLAAAVLRAARRRCP